MFDRLRNTIEDPRTERYIMARNGPILSAIDRIIIAIFVIEILARFIVQRGAFFRDGWNIFDVFVVGVALAPATSGFARSGSCDCSG